MLDVFEVRDHEFHLHFHWISLVLYNGISSVDYGSWPWNIPSSELRRLEGVLTCKEQVFLLVWMIHTFLRAHNISICSYWSVLMKPIHERLRQVEPQVSSWPQESNCRNQKTQILGLWWNVNLFLSHATLISKHCRADDLKTAEEYRTSKGFSVVHPVCNKIRCRNLDYKQMKQSTSQYIPIKIQEYFSIWIFGWIGMQICFIMNQGSWNFCWPNSDFGARIQSDFLHVRMCPCANNVNLYRIIFIIV